MDALGAQDLGRARINQRGTGKWDPGRRSPVPSLRRELGYSTFIITLALWLLNSGAYMHWISAMPVG